MKLPLYAVRDIATGFWAPTSDQNDQTAIRNFKFMMNNSDSVVGFAPKDYDLYRVGEYDSDAGLLIPLQVPVLVLRGTAAIGD